MEKGKGERHQRLVEALFPFLFSLFLFSGCGTPGDPRPPRPTVPTAIADLAARQMGNRVVLTFTLPERSTEGETLMAAPDIEIYRGFAARGASATPPAQLVLIIPSALVDTYTSEGRVQFEDPVKPEDLATHRNDQWVYAVRTRVPVSSAKKHSSDASNVVAVRVLPVPPTAKGLAATVTEPAIELRWQRVEEAITYRVFRSESDAPPDAPNRRVTPPVLLGATPVTSYRDPQFEFGRRYVYTVRAVAQLDTDSIESDASTPVEVQPEDTFPPATPSNVVAVLIPATADAPAAIELSWSISAEDDAAGYHLYRSEQEGAPGQRISRDLLSAPSFRDTSVTMGRRYHYRITALDRKGNESPRSAPVSEIVPEQQR